jgi:Histidine kinase-, DNA gyrase B-, and HSP90-like ATPase
MTVATRLSKPTDAPIDTVAATEIKLGKDILELISTAMYVDPMVVYREYLQNAADAIDEARAVKLLSPDEAGRVDLFIDPSERTIRIRDNGAGVAPEDFATRMTALGGSAKRGTAARGFRGVGRLSGLGYAQELVFRSRVSGQPDVSVIRWDCRRLKAALADSSFDGDVAHLISNIVSVSHEPAADYPDRFFEVELSKVVRQRNDKLMDAAAVADYLAQIAPAPFAPEFRFGAEIAAAIRSAADLSELQIQVNGAPPLVRPHRNEVEVGPARTNSFEDLTIVEVPGIDGQVAAVAWFLHHGYEGALTVGTLIKGVRLRVGNLQIGDSAILEDIFPEIRFNSWSVGEVHVLDPRIVPNGRRDQFEQNAHFSNLINQLGPSARDIARRCRTNSARRSKLREFELCAGEVRGRIDVLRQGSLDRAARDGVATSAETTVLRMEKIAGLDLLVDDAPEALCAQIDGLRAELVSSLGDVAKPLSPLDRLPADERVAFERMFSLIYECSTNRAAAKALVDRILLKVVPA